MGNKRIPIKCNISIREMDAAEESRLRYELKNFVTQLVRRQLAVKVHNHEEEEQIKKQALPRPLPCK